MKNVIWKYPLKVTNVQDIEIPNGSEILSVQTQDETPCLWVLVNNPEADKTTIRFMTIGTGVTVSEELNGYTFVGTYQLHQGSFVGHLFFGNPKRYLK